MPIDPHRLLVLRAVHRTGSVHAAATALHLTPSGVSQHLSRLEAEARLPLLDRTRRGGGRAVRLTEAGLALAQRADDVAVALAEAQREADRLREGTAGTVRVGGFATALGHLVVPTLQQLAITDAALAVQVIEVNERDGTDLLRAGDLDLLIGERYVEATTPDAAGSYPGLVERVLYREPFRIVLPELWPTPGGLDELLAGTWVTSREGRPPRQMLDRLCAEQAVTPGHRHICTESQTMLALVAAGLGAAIVPELTLAYLRTEGVVVHASAVDVGSRLLTVTGSRRERRASAPLRFLEALREVIARVTSAGITG
ncbi:LysR family transcriptional regulator [Actinomycetospora sp. NBRC 106378]|uniref:LysR family transcriptional regulator n=1 Tax=Actinomycetospora sp. NBRC 106378 TaxID=3032208 RepID=UPI0024A2BBB9|nr:LysR family transcriptional regulator [Actinomycetospora sp. NBRC 106378]GLZ50622.1 LysR family transcriptional regulator [Actinomycetospora sp. NBRC 106378]